ncbi:PilN domain-containing protein [Luteimonas sp. A478]
MTDADHIASPPTPPSPPSLIQRLWREGGSRLGPWLGFWLWWGRALATWVPARLRALLGLDGRRLLLRHASDELSLVLEHSEGEPELARLPWVAADADGGAAILNTLLPAQLSALPRWLVLPAGTALRRPMTVPIAAADRLREVLGFEIDRQTPFAANEVCFDARLIRRRSDGQLDVELVVVPRAAFDAAIAALGGAGTGLAGVDLDDDDDSPLGINLLPEAAREHRADPWQRWNLALATLAVLAVASAMWMVLDNRRQAADAFEQASQQLIAQARQASDQRRQVADHIEGMQYLDELRAAQPAMVEILDELSRLLPDSTYLEKLAVENGRLLLIGQSTEASALVQQLGDSELWHSPALAGALQPDPRSRRDRFTLTAEVASTPGPVAPAAADTSGGANAQPDP